MLSTKVEETVDKTNEESGLILTTSRVFNRFTQVMFILIGVHVGRTRCSCAYIIFTLTTIFVTIFSVYNNWTRGTPIILTAAKASFHFIPLMEFTRLHFTLDKLNVAVDLFFHDFDVQVIMSSLFLRKVKKFHISLTVAILVQQFLLFSSSIASLMQGRPWIIQQFLQVDFGVNLFYDTVSCILYVYQAFIENYIALSVSLYLSYLMIIIHCKELTLDMISSGRSLSHHQTLSKLDDLMNVFEVSLSSLPLTWLFFGIGPGLIYTVKILLVQVDGYGLIAPRQKFFFSCYQVGSIIFNLGSFFLVSKWQENVNQKVAHYIGQLEERAKLPEHYGLIHRMERVLCRSATVASVYPIDRSLIIAYIGSAITFTTLILQLQR